MKSNVNRREFLKQLGAGAVALTVPGCISQGIKSPEATGKRPNFVFILIDDLGWMDLGYTRGGSTSPTGSAEVKKACCCRRLMNTNCPWKK